MSVVNEKTELIFSKVHEINERTADVITETNFSQLMINPTIVDSLTRHGFTKPSPVQVKAIPLGLLGMDMLVQAKTGTGKTLVFSILCADTLLNTEQLERTPQIMIVSPTREIAAQTHEVVRRICPRNVRCGLFVGGVDMELDKRTLRFCQVAVGTSGRLAHLVKCRLLRMQKVSLFVLDEADRLMEDSFKAEVNYLFSSLTPDFAQVCVFSATYPRGLDRILSDYMKEPSLIRLNSDDMQLLGVRQYAIVDETRDSLDVLLAFLNSTNYTQCLVFTNEQKRCSEISDFLKANEILASQFSSALAQDERFKVMKNFRNFRIRLLVSSDLSSRGIDAKHVNLIVNMECPMIAENYLHRVGRAGRFGTRGAAVTILANDFEVHRFKVLVQREQLRVKLLSADMIHPNDLPMNVEFYDEAEDFKKIIDEDRVRYIKMVNEHRDKDNVSPASTSASDSDATLDEGSVGDTTFNLPKVIVPQRGANRRKYYLRSEMLAIRDWATPVQWRALARRNLDKLDATSTMADFAAILHTSDQITNFNTTNNNSRKKKNWKIHTQFSDVRTMRTEASNQHETTITLAEQNVDADAGDSHAASSSLSYCQLPLQPTVSEKPPPPPSPPPRDVPRRAPDEYRVYMQKLMRKMAAEKRLRVTLSTFDNFEGSGKIDTESLVDASKVEVSF